jgi:hypothetical protein
MNNLNRLVLVGNGFDLAHGLKTSYRNFIDWYMCKAFHEFCQTGFYEDRLISVKRKNGMTTQYKSMPVSFTEVIDLISYNSYQELIYKSKFYKYLLDLFGKGWVDIEHQYFQRLKVIFKISSLSEDEKKVQVAKLNEEFDHLISLLTEYILIINSQIPQCNKLPIASKKQNLVKAFQPNGHSPVTFVTFNYTETLQYLGYADEHEIIHIHGRASDVSRNPIIFGYGDETDPVYQMIEDSGRNEYLEHIKSFGYFKTDNYSRLIKLIDSAPFKVYIIGHSCGLSDRILLNEIFEHNNCHSIELFYHQRKDGSDNFKEITQEISRHFKPQNKNLMRRKVMPKDPGNIIPQSI